MTELNQQQCSVCKQEFPLKEGFYTYTYIRAGKVIRKYMGVCKTCVKLRRIMRSYGK